MARQAITERADQHRLDGPLENLFRLTHDLIAVVNFEGHFETVSPSWTDTLGWSEEELKEKPIWQLIHPDDLPAAQATAKKFMESGGNLARFRNRYRCKDGSYRHISWTNYTDLEAQRVYCVARDITSMAGQADELLELLFMTPDLIAIGPGNGTFDIVSPSWEAVLGWSVEEMTSMVVLDLIHPDDLEASVAEASRVKTTGDPALRFENRYRCKDGSYRNLSWTAYADTDRDRFYCIARDVTELRQQADRLEAQTKAWQAFANTLVHDIRSPVRSMGGLADVLLRQPERLDSPDAKRYLQMIVARARTVDDMTSKLLAYASSSHSPLDLGPVDMHAIVMEAIELALDEFDGDEPWFDVAPLPPVQGDANLLGIAVMNLVQNACKYAVGNKPRIEITATTGIGRVTYSFKDNGVGFSPDAASGIWEPLVRDHDNSVAGTGLGLATVKRIVEQHGGSVHCESQPGQGARFDISLPA